MVEPARAEQGRPYDQWNIGNTAHKLMQRISMGVIPFQDYRRAVAEAHAATDTMQNPVLSTITFHEDFASFDFSNFSIIREGARIMSLGIRDGKTSAKRIGLETTYRQGMGFHDGQFSLTNYDPETEQLPRNAPVTAERILDMCDRYLPIDPYDAKTLRDEVMLLSSRIPQEHSITQPA